MRSLRPRLLRLTRRRLLTAAATGAAAAVALARRPAFGTAADRSASLADPYEDPAQAEVPFGAHSYYRAPWRAYMDTWPASRFLEVPGIVFNLAGDRPAGELAATAALLAEAGIRVGRVEFGWLACDYDDPSTLNPYYEMRFRALLTALRDAGIRPLILLNANHGIPCPRKRLDVAATASAAAGARTITLSGDLAAIVPHKTGLAQAGKSGFPLITAADTGTGVCDLSAPLAVDIPAGPLALFVHRYHPFSPPTFADGAPNPLSRETVDGWMAYVQAVAALALGVLGPGGWDFEVWNEYTFGSAFLDERHYYDPARAFAGKITYVNHGLTYSGGSNGCEVILPMTVDLAAASFPGVNVISGFSNQRPWESGTGMWPGQAGFSRHYYTGIGNDALAPDHSAQRPAVDATGAVETIPTLMPHTTVAPGDGPLVSAPIDTAAGGAAWTGVGLQYQLSGTLPAGESVAVGAQIEESDDLVTWADVPGEADAITASGALDRWRDLTLPLTGRRRHLRLRLTVTFSEGASGTVRLFARGKTAFVPPGLRRDCPEYWFYAYQTEFVTRDIQPIGPSPAAAYFGEHHRFSIREGFPGLARPAEVWMTECGTFRRPWVQRVIAEAGGGVAQMDPRLIALSHRINAKCLLRTYVFGAHKGLRTLCAFAVRGGEHAHAHVPDGFFALLEAWGHVVDDEVRAAFGEPMRVVKRIADLMRTGSLGSDPGMPAGAVPRKLTVEHLVEHGPRLVFRGDGTAAHPDRWNRDDLAVLPYQTAANRYAVAVYVVTRDAAAVHDASKGPLDPERYAFPEQTFDLTLGNVRGEGAAVAVYDPMTAERSPVPVIEAAPTSLTVRLPVVDYPRFLEITEDRPGPLILSPALDTSVSPPALTFATNLDTAPTVTWGARPGRADGGSLVLPAGAGHAARVGGALPPGHGVRVAVEVDRLRVWWPQWGHDIAGMRPMITD